MILSISNQKGGVNKTTLTFNIGYLLAEQGKKTLLVDLDPQGSLTTIFNIDANNDIYDVLIDKKPINSAILPIEDNLYLIPGGIRLANAEIELAGVRGRESVLKEVLYSIDKEFDYILIDCLPSLGLLLVNALNAADKVIIPTATDFLSYKGLDLLLDTIAKVKVNLNNNLDILGIVATMHDNRTLHNKEILEILAGEFEILATIGTSIKVKDSTLAGQPLHRFDKKHKIVNQYQEITRRIINGK